MSEVLNENELKDVNGGHLHNYPVSNGFKVMFYGAEYDVVDSSWDPPCRALGHEPSYNRTRISHVYNCKDCTDFGFLSDHDLDKINGWDGYCKAW